MMNDMTNYLKYDLFQMEKTILNIKKHLKGECNKINIFLFKNTVAQGPS